MRKFIITGDGELRLGDVNMHKDLLQPGETCIGGGYYEWDYVGARLLLDGKSYDFGRPRWHLVDAVRVPKVYEGFTICWEGEPITQWTKVVYE
ncbi:MAG: hypothetical protein LIO90_01340 [Bacteroidales bacterium]|nr:hypothetical protein [Bacteroidales bacterium]